MFKIHIENISKGLFFLMTLLCSFKYFVLLYISNFIKQYLICGIDVSQKEELEVKRYYNQIFC